VRIRAPGALPLNAGVLQTEDGGLRPGNMTETRIVEGGCTTLPNPPIPPAVMKPLGVAHIAAFSPAAVIGVQVCVSLLGERDSPSRSPLFGLSVIGVALALCVVALFASKDRSRRLALAGLAGNVALLIVQLLWSPSTGAARVHRDSPGHVIGPAIALQNNALQLTAPLGGRAGHGVVDAAASRSPFGERRRRS